MLINNRLPKLNDGLTNSDAVGTKQGCERPENVLSPLTCKPDKSLVLRRQNPKQFFCNAYNSDFFDV